MQLKKLSENTFVRLCGGNTLTAVEVKYFNDRNDMYMGRCNNGLMYHFAIWEVEQVITQAEYQNS